MVSNESKLPVSEGEVRYYNLPEIYSNSLTLVSYLSSDPKVGGKYEDLFSPAVSSISEKDGLKGIVSKFLIENYPEEKIALDKKASLEDKIEFLEIEGYMVASIFESKTEPKRYTSIPQDGYEEIGGIITTRTSQYEQAEMWAKELNGEPFVFSFLYQTSKADPDNLSHPLYAVANIKEIEEALEQIELKESKTLVKKDWQNLKYMSTKCKKNCWLEAVSQDARAFDFTPDDIKGNSWSILAAVNKTNQPEVILAYAKTGENLIKVCDLLLKKGMITFNQLPENLQSNDILLKYNSINASYVSNNYPYKEKQVSHETLEH